MSRATRPKRLVVAPDGFGGLFEAAVAAQVLAEGWAEESPADTVDLVPLSDGGPGFVAALHAALGGRLVDAEVTGPTGRPTGAQLLVADQTAWIESAEACGLHLLTPEERDPRRTTSAGVGDLVLAAVRAGAGRCVVGLGGSGTNDGGAGVWAALGAEPADALRNGGGGLGAVPGLRPPDVGHLPALVAATDVDSPLLGPAGASAVFGPQKGADPATVLDLDDALRAWADAVEPLVGRPGLRDAPGAGAAGGLGFGLLALGARRESGARIVMDAVQLDERIAQADLVVTGEGSLDAQSVRGKVVGAVARAAQRAGVPCIAVAGRVLVGEREAAAWGLDATYSVADLAGSPEAALELAEAGVRAAARIAARDWKL